MLIGEMEDDTILGRVALRDNNNVSASRTVNIGGGDGCGDVDYVDTLQSKKDKHFQKDDEHCRLLLLHQQQKQQDDVRLTTKLLGEIGKSRDGNILVSAPKRFLRRIKDTMTPIAASVGANQECGSVATLTALSKQLVSSNSYHPSSIRATKADSEPIRRHQCKKYDKLYANSLSCEKENSLYPTCNFNNNATGDNTLPDSIHSESSSLAASLVSTIKPRKNKKIKSCKSTGAVPEAKTSISSSIADSFNLKRYFSKNVSTCNREIQTDVFDEPLKKKVLTDKEIDKSVLTDEFISENFQDTTYWKTLATERLVEIEELTRENEQLHDIVESLTSELKEQSETVKELLSAVDDEFTKEEVV